MTEKRARRPEEAPAEKPGRDDQRAKRRKLDAGQSPKKQKTPKKDPTRSPEKDAGAIAKPKAKKAVSKELAVVEPVEAEIAVAQEETEEADGWRLSPQTGGRQLTLDPVFSPDEKHILLSLEYAVQVYSMATSRAVRAFSFTTSSSVSTALITGCVLSPVNSDIVYVSNSQGDLSEWNWTTGIGSRVMQIPGSILSIRAAPASPSSEKATVFALALLHTGKREISVNLMDRSTKSKSRRCVILTTDRSIKDIRVALDGAAIFAVAEDTLIVGLLTKGSAKDDGIHSVQYTWREVKMPVKSTCFDVRKVGEAAKPGLKVMVDLAVGEEGGAIIVYRDVLNTIQEIENPRMAEAGLSSHRLHWHRGAVQSVRWSKDGNYLISGGLETVLVLWQMDTGRKQFLPHLSSPICNIVVSPSGSNYAIKLADNSTMVLTTSELKPIASMNGLQIPDQTLQKRQQQLQKRKKAIVPPTAFSARLPAIIHPIHTDHLLLPISTSPEDASSLSYLQTFDIRSNQQVYRQALARTNVSVLNRGPQGTELSTPDIKFIQVTSDGTWLASIDEWRQYPEDMDILHPNSEAEHAGLTARAEIHFKFWRWSEQKAEWELVSRVNSPHPTGPGLEASPILDLAVHPTEHMFVTAGSDGVRIWVPSRSSSKEKKATVKSWQCTHAIPLEPASSEPAASLGFSEDGSTLAVCWSSATRGQLVHLIDPTTGIIHLTREGLCTGPPQACGFLDRHMIIVSNTVCVWDTVSDRIVSRLGPGSPDERADKVQSMLAINPRTRTFATCFMYVAVRRKEKHSKAKRKLSCSLAIFEPGRALPVFERFLHQTPHALLPDLKTGEYILIDTWASISRVTSGAQMFTSVPSTVFDGPGVRGLRDIFGRRTLPTKTIEAGEEDKSAVIEGGKVNKNLAEVFEAPSFALPSVDALFNTVVGIFAS